MNTLDGRYLIMSSVYRNFHVLVSIMCSVYGILQEKRAANSSMRNFFSVTWNFFANKKMHEHKE